MTRQVRCTKWKTYSGWTRLFGIEGVPGKLSMAVDAGARTRASEALGTLARAQADRAATSVRAIQQRGRPNVMPS